MDYSRDYPRSQSQPDEDGSSFELNPIRRSEPVRRESSFADDSSYAEYFDYDADFDDVQYVERPLSPPPVQRRSIPQRMFTRQFVVGMLGIGVMLGFALGLMATNTFDGIGNSSPPLFDEDLVTRVFDQASPAIAEIVVERPSGFGVDRTSTGSGFLIDREGHVITNNHVIQGARQIEVMMSDGRALPATLLGNSPADDLALLQVDPKEVADITPLDLADSEMVRAGQLAIAVGSPFRNFNSVTVGVVSGTGRGPTSQIARPIPNMIQTDAPLNPGNSGGPLLNAEGQVIGVNSAVRTASGGGLSDFRIGFAVPSNTIKNLMPDLITAGELKRPYLGISGGEISDDLSSQLGLNKGIVISRVTPGSPADVAGLRPFTTFRNGDIITGVDGNSVGSVEEMVNYFNSRRPGDAVTLSVYRNSRTVEVEVTLAAWPDS